jgi:hypothetical protein
MSYRIEQNDNNIFFILYDIHFFTIKDRSAIIFGEKIKIMKNVPIQAIFTGKINELNSACRRW